MSRKHEKYTIRNVPNVCIDRLREVREASGIPIGRLVHDAVELWWNSLPFEDPPNAPL